MLDQTLVVWMGEFGRTPKINPNAGRDHFPKVFNVALAGGGIKGGQVIGASNARRHRGQGPPVTVPDLLASLCHSLKIDPTKENMSPIGRPIKIVDGGKLVPALYSPERAPWCSSSNSVWRHSVAWALWLCCGLGLPSWSGSSRACHASRAAPCTRRFSRRSPTLVAAMGSSDGVVRGVVKGRRITLAFQGEIPAACQQQLRNLWAISGWSVRGDAPGSGRRTRRHNPYNRQRSPHPRKSDIGVVSRIQDGQPARDRALS